MHRKNAKCSFVEKRIKDVDALTNDHERGFRSNPAMTLKFIRASLPAWSRRKDEKVGDGAHVVPLAASMPAIALRSTYVATVAQKS